MITRIFLIVAAMSIAILSLPVAAMAEFVDVPRGHWAYEAVDYLEEEGLVTGYPDGTFRGDTVLTRFEFAYVIMNMYEQFMDRPGASNHGGSTSSGRQPDIDVQAIVDMLMDEFEPEIDDLRALIVDNIARIEDLEGTVGGFDDKIADIDERIGDMEDEFATFGDLRLRFEGKYPEEGSQTQRPRYRIRWGFKSHITDELTFGARFGSGSKGGITSTNRTIGDEFGFDELTIDRAYLEYEPASMPGFTFWGGKFSPPWVTTYLGWDSDAMVEGIAQHYNYENFNFYLGELVPDEMGFYLVAQAGMDDILMEGVDFYVTYHYINDDCWQFIEEKMMEGDLKSRWDFDALDMDDYQAVEAYGAWSGMLGDIKVKVEGNYLRNMASSNDESEAPDYVQAAWARVSINGSPKNPGDWRLRGEWGRTQRNSVLSWLTDSDRGSGDHDWWGINWTYRLLRNTDLGITYINKDRISRDNHMEDLVQVDIATKF